MTASGLRAYFQSPEVDICFKCRKISSVVKSPKTWSNLSPFAQGRNILLYYQTDTGAERCLQTIILSEEQPSFRAFKVMACNAPWEEDAPRCWHKEGQNAHSSSFSGNKSRTWRVQTATWIRTWREDRFALVQFSQGSCMSKKNPPDTSSTYPLQSWSLKVEKLQTGKPLRLLHFP